MKRKLILAAVALLMAGSAGLFAAKPSVEQQQQLAAAMKTLVENRNYSVRVQQASGVKGGGIATNSLLKVNGETAYSSMPYWGGGYNNFGNNDGMRFNGTISDYTVTVDKKNKVRVAFKVTTDTKRVDRYKRRGRQRGPLIGFDCTFRMKNSVSPAPLHRIFGRFDKCLLFL